MNDLAHQDELNRIEQLEGIIYHKDKYGAEFSTQVWEDDGTVYINVRSGVSIISLNITKDAADVLADQIAVALRRWA